MGFRVTRAFFALVLVVSSPCLLAENAYRIDVSYAEANPDFSAFSNGEGLSSYAEAAHDNGVFGALWHSDVSFRPSGMVSGGKIRYWQSFDVGYRHELNTRWNIEARINLQQNERKTRRVTEKETGHGYELGAAFSVLDPLHVRLNVGKLDLLIDDWYLRSEVQMDFSDRIYAIARLRDYADWDFTYYEFGLGVQF